MIARITVVAVLAATVAVAFSQVGASAVPRDRSAALATTRGSTYTLHVRGRGAAAVFGSGSGLAIAGRPFTFTATAGRAAIVSIGGADAMLRRGLAAPAILARKPVARDGIIEADLAVVGCHAAGLAAAVAAARRGISVVLLCAESFPGGMLTAGNVSVADGAPVFSWPETPNSSVANGSLPRADSWALTGGLWRDFRSAVARAGAPNDGIPPLRWDTSQAFEAVRSLVRLPGLLVLTGTVPRDATFHDGRIESLRMRGAWSGTVRASVWVDGSDTGELVGLLGLPAHIGADDGSATGSSEVMAYAYRWTAVEGDVPSKFPVAPPLYYDINRLDYRGATAERWPDYKRAFNIQDGSAYAVHPFRLFNRLGRLSGGMNDPIADPATGLLPAGSPEQRWNVNGAMNNAGSTWIARLLVTNPVIADVFKRNVLPNPYLPPIDPRWSNVDWLEQSAPVPTADRLLLVAKIDEAVRAKAQGLLWYIRSGDMLEKLRSISGAQNLTLRAAWSFGGSSGDGLPEMMYRREGRRVVGETTLGIGDLCPSFDADRAAGRACTTAPHTFADSIALADYSVDIHGTGNRPPEFFALPQPYEIPFSALIPRGTTGILIGGAISTDRYAYAATRVDPTRLMIGTAIGEAAALAILNRQFQFQRIDVSRLRAALAFDHQQTRFTALAPGWDTANRQWINDGVGTALQLLLSRPAADPGITPGSAAESLLQPGSPLTGSYVVTLSRVLGVSVPSGLSNRPVTLRALARVPIPGMATVGDLYTLMAARVVAGR